MCTTYPNFSLLVKPPYSAFYPSASAARTMFRKYLDEQLDGADNRLAEQLDAHRKRRQEAHPNLTMTQMNPEVGTTDELITPLGTRDVPTT